MVPNTLLVESLLLRVERAVDVGGWNHPPALVVAYCWSAAIDERYAVKVLGGPGRLLPVRAGQYAARLVVGDGLALLADEVLVDPVAGLHRLAGERLFAGSPQPAWMLARPCLVGLGAVFEQVVGSTRQRLVVMVDVQGRRVGLVRAQGGPRPVWRRDAVPQVAAFLGRMLARTMSQPVPPALAGLASEL